MSKDLPIEYDRYNNRFYVVSTKSGINCEAYIDEDAYGKYKAMKNTDPITLDLQNQGLNLPILKTKAAAFWSKKLMTVYEPELPIKKKFSLDNCKEFCSIRKKRTHECIEYDLSFKNFDIKMYHHKKYPFADFVYNGLRYRWIEFSSIKDHRRIEADYHFSLYELTKEQETLIDGLVDGKVSKENALASKFIKTKHILKSINLEDLDGLKSDRKIGQFDLINYKLSGKKIAVFEINLSKLITSIKDLPLEFKIYLCMIALFKYDQDMKEINKTVAVS